MFSPTIKIMVFGISFGVATFLCMTHSYRMQYAHYTPSDVHVVYAVIREQVVSVAAAICASQSVPYLCPSDGGHTGRIGGTYALDPPAAHDLGLVLDSTAGTTLIVCRCFSQVLVDERVFYNQLVVTVLPVQSDVSIHVLASLANAATRVLPLVPIGSAEQKIVSTLTGLLISAQQALDGVRSEVDMGFHRIRFVNGGAYAALKLAHLIDPVVGIATGTLVSDRLVHHFTRHSLVATAHSIRAIGGRIDVVSRALGDLLDAHAVLVEQHGLELASHSATRRREVKSTLIIWRELVEISSLDLAMNPSETLQAFTSGATGLSGDVGLLWTQFSELYERLFFHIDLTEITFIENAQPILEAAMKSVNEKSQSLAAVMEEWASSFATMLTLDGLDNAIRSVEERTQANQSPFIDVLAPHVDRLRLLAASRDAILKDCQDASVIRDEGEDTIDRFAMYLDDLAAQRAVMRRAITSILHIFNATEALTSSVTGHDGRDFPLAKFVDVLPAYNKAKLLSEEIYGVKDLNSAS
ncbi:hypothetical protein C8T65DRAFT_745743 [Cerioporus squamosus]|nr:hypothetical protein C8T65DRAFT_745743 [Cerioporus squamosus]